MNRIHTKSTQRQRRFGGSGEVVHRLPRGLILRARGQPVNNFG